MEKMEMKFRKEEWEYWRKTNEPLSHLQPATKQFDVFAKQRDRDLILQMISQLVEQPHTKQPERRGIYLRIPKNEKQKLIK
jgi:hypothetical protein